MGVEYADGQLGQWPARIVATDAAHDVAVLRIDAPPEKLQPVKVPRPAALCCGRVQQTHSMRQLVSAA